MRLVSGDEKDALRVMPFSKPLSTLAILLSVPLFLGACSYGPERVITTVENAVAKPGTHTFAVAVDFKVLQFPTGSLNTFPSGGIPRIIKKEARIYLVNVADQSFELVASIENYDGIPQAKRVSVNGWVDGSLYFTLSGYGGNSWQGDDLNDERRLRYKISPSGKIQRLVRKPEQVEAESGPNQSERPPFLSVHTSFGRVTAWIDGMSVHDGRKAVLLIDQETGEVTLEVDPPVERGASVPTKFRPLSDIP